jgi:hypothetical protein
MLEKICNNHLYTTDIKYSEDIPISHDEFLLEIKEEEDEELQDKIYDYYNGGE